jgi:hypothetical protein
MVSNSSSLCRLISCCVGDGDRGRLWCVWSVCDCVGVRFNWLASSCLVRLGDGVVKGL